MFSKTLQLIGEIGEDELLVSFPNALFKGATALVEECLHQQ